MPKLDQTGLPVPMQLTVLRIFNNAQCDAVCMLPCSDLMHIACPNSAMSQALQQREESVRNGKLTTIIFIRDKNAKGQEISGYIDYGHR